MIFAFNIFLISPFPHYHHHYYQAKDTCMRIITMNNTLKHIEVQNTIIEVQNTIMTQKSGPMYVVHPILGLRPQNFVTSRDIY